MFIVFLRRSRSYVAQSRALLVVQGPRARWERMLAECPHRPAPPQSAQDRAACGTACVAAGRLALFASALLDRSLLSLCPVVEKKVAPAPNGCRTMSRQSQPWRWFTKVHHLLSRKGRRG